MLRKIKNGLYVSIFFLLALLIAGPTIPIDVAIIFAGLIMSFAGFSMSRAGRASLKDVVVGNFSDARQRFKKGL